VFRFNTRDLFRDCFWPSVPNVISNQRDTVLEFPVDWFAI
jgi:hypothetical protein